MNAYATILEKGRGWVTIAHHPGGIDTVIGRFTAKYQAKACADTFNNAAASAPPTSTTGSATSAGEPAMTDADLYNQMLDDADLHELKHAATTAVTAELVAAVERHSNMLADLVDLLNTIERRVAALEHPKPVH